MYYAYVVSCNSAPLPSHHIMFGHIISYHSLSLQSIPYLGTSIAATALVWELWSQGGTRLALSCIMLTMMPLASMAISLVWDQGQLMLTVY